MFSRIDFLLLATSDREPKRFSQRWIRKNPARFRSETVKGKRSNVNVSIGLGTADSGFHSVLVNVIDRIFELRLGWNGWRSDMEVVGRLGPQVYQLLMNCDHLSLWVERPSNSTDNGNNFCQFGTVSHSILLSLSNDHGPLMRNECLFGFRDHNNMRWGFCGSQIVDEKRSNGYEARSSCHLDHDWNMSSCVEPAILEKGNGEHGTRCWWTMEGWIITEQNRDCRNDVWWSRIFWMYPGISKRTVCRRSYTHCVKSDRRCYEFVERKQFCGMVWDLWPRQICGIVNDSLYFSPPLTNDNEFDSVTFVMSLWHLFFPMWPAFCPVCVICSLINWSLWLSLKKSISLVF